MVSFPKDVNMQRLVYRQAVVFDGVFYQQLEADGGNPAVCPLQLFIHIDAYGILSELIVENRTLAERFLENLSSVYRYVIQNLKRDTVPVSEELDFLRSYLYLIGMRYENAISGCV